MEGSRTSDQMWHSEMEVKRMAKEYSSGRLPQSVSQIERARPKLLHSAGIDPGMTENLPEWDERRMSGFSKGDQDLLRYYISQREKTYFLKHAVNGIEKTRLREIAEDTLLKGIRCEDLLDKYGLSRRQMFEQKKAAVEEIARKWEKQGPQSWKR